MRKKIFPGLHLGIAMLVWIFWGVKVAQALVLVTNDVIVPTTWTKANSPYVIQNFIEIKAPLVIEAGTVIKFQNFESDGGPTVPGLGIQSAFTAVGSPLEKIVFTSACDSNYGGDTQQDCSSKMPSRSGSWDSLRVWVGFGQPVLIEYVKILNASNGVTYVNSQCNFSYRDLTVRNTEISFASSAGIALQCVQPILDSLKLTFNYDGIYVSNSVYNYTPKIRNSILSDNRNAGVEAYRYTYFDARYNYWGDASGPYYGYDNQGNTEGPNKSGSGNRIVGTSVLFRPWDKSDPTIPKKPVIFIPGIGASINPDLMIGGVFADNWTMFDHTYDGILKAFKVMGYQEGKNFFIAYYDWRQGNGESAEKYLKPLIKKALTLNDVTQVNLVTHSMGSLVARSYVQSSSYANNVDNLIMIAPPNRGSSDVYTLWEGGYIPKNWSSRTAMVYYLAYLQLINLETSRYNIIHKYIPSLKDLLPVYDFLFPTGKADELKNFFDMQERNDFLLDLNKSVAGLKTKTDLSIILGDKQPTVSKIPFVDSDQAGLWLDGKPSPLDPVRDDASGDGEVLRLSGDIPSNFWAVLNYDHSAIVSKSEKIVADLLGETLTDTFDSPEIKDEIIFWTDAPGDLKVSDPDGASAPKDNNEDTDVRYAQEEGKDGFKIVSVPNVKNGQYHVELQGHENGNYHLATEYVDHKNENQQEAVQVVQTQKDQTQNFVVTVDPKNPVTPIQDVQLQDEIAPTITLQAPEDGKAYANDQILPIVFSVSDNVSKEEDLVVEKYLDDDSQLFEADSIDFAKLALGQHVFWINVYDEAGNYNSVGVSFEVKQAETPSNPPADNGSGNQDQTGGSGGAGGGNQNNGNTDPDSGSNSNGGSNSNSNSNSNSGSQPVTEAVVAPTQSAAAQENSGSNRKKSASHKKKKQIKTISTTTKFIEGGGVTKSSEPIKVLFSSNFNLSKNSEEQQNLFYQVLEENLKGQLLAMEENPIQDEETFVTFQAMRQRNSFFAILARADKNLFKFLGGPIVLGAERNSKQADANFEQLRAAQKKAEKSRLALLLEFAFALAATIFFALSFFRARFK